ncbi:VID27-like protein [Cylas formicarius]|uniref:VID27-like protein n=1 Tax=Cylas formicarius TaxID=197179 RepID=UPI0029583215|nr:VID27-like protein [Cylas formicarius]
MSRRQSSENEDDPEPFQSSGDEWDLEQAKLEESGRRKSSRLTKKPKRAVVDESVSESEESEEISSDEEQNEKKRKVKKQIKASPKKQKVINESDQSNDKTEDNNSKKESEIASTDSDSSRNATAVSNVGRAVPRKFVPKTIFSEDYATGSFVILKKDAQVGDPSKHPCIWRIDGKALLQKYEAFDEDDKVRHKNTSIYTGWSPLDKDLYAPITVDVVRHNNNNLTVEVHWDKVNIINADSD